MAVDATAAAATTSTSQASATDSGNKSVLGRSKLSENFDTFLVMLTTQLKHQDPLSPMDSTQFTNQLVQFANVEQQINANQNLESLISIQKVNQTAMAIGYMGQTVEIPSLDVPLQDSKAFFSYNLPEDARGLVVTISDSTGKEVAQFTDLNTTKGRHEVFWNGKDKSGKQMADGSYTVKVEAAKQDMSPLSASVSTYGKVTDVAGDSNGTLLSAGGVVFKLDDVLTLRDPTSVKPRADGQSGNVTAKTVSSSTSNSNSSSSDEAA